MVPTVSVDGRLCSAIGARPTFKNAEARARVLVRLKSFIAAKGFEFRLWCWTGM